MSIRVHRPDVMQYFRKAVASVVLFQLVAGTSVFAQTADTNTTSPIKHVIVIIGENRSFDHVFATYQPKRGQTVWNLLSEGIVNADGTPGPNFSRAQQNAAVDQSTQVADTFLLSPPAVAFPGSVL